MRIPPGPPHRAGTLSKLFLLASMYFCQAIPMGYVFGSMPVIMREGHMSLQSIGGLFVLHLPWAVKFLYASWVDRMHIPALGRRRSWIFPLQWIAAGLLVVVSRTPPETEFSTMFALLLLLNIVMATNDIAVDGYATDILEPRERAWGNTVQAGARYVGMMLGGGVMLFLHSSVGWQALCLVLSATVFTLSLPVFLLRELAPVHPPKLGGEQGPRGVWAFLRRREILGLLPVLIAPTAFAFSSFMMRLPMLVDLGFTSRELGGILMHYAYPAGLAGTVLTGWLLSRIGPTAYLRGFSTIVAGLCAYTVVRVNAGSLTMWKAAVMLCLDNALMGGINVWGFTLMMRVCVGSHSGTGFAVLSSLFILVPLMAAPFLGRLGDALGFGWLYSLLGALVLAGFMLSEIAGHLQKHRRGRTASMDAAL